MSFLETLFPQIVELEIPIILILLGIAISFIFGWIPIVGGKFIMLGIGIIATGLLYWIISTRIQSINPNFILIGVLGLILVTITFFLFKKRK